MVIKRKKQRHASGRSLVNAGGERVTTSDPVPTVRDPVQPDHIPHAPHVLRMEIEKPVCVKCGRGSFRNCNARRPCYTTGKMTCRKECSWCGQKYLFVNDPTPEEIEQHWKD